MCQKREPGIGIFIFIIGKDARRLPKLDLVSADTYLKNFSKFHVIVDFLSSGCKRFRIFSQCPNCHL